MKKCGNCGAEMLEDELVCNTCGAQYAENAEIPEVEAIADVQTPAEVIPADAACADVKAEPTEPTAEKPVRQKKVKWWYIAIPAVLVVAIIAGVLLGPLFIYLAPEVVLAKALAATVADLSARTEGTPLAIMAKANDGSMKNTMTMDFDISQPMIGNMHVGVEAKVDSMAKESLIGIRADVMGQALDMNLYIDRDVAAINMDLLTGKTYYGVYYDTFGQDIRENEFLYETIGEENVAIMEVAFDAIDKAMDLEVVTPEQQAASLKKYGETILEFVTQKDPVVKNDSVSVDGKAKNCKVLYYTFSNRDYAELMLKLIDIAENDPLAIYYYQSNSLDYDGEGWAELLAQERETFEKLKDRDEDGDCVISFSINGGKVVQIGMAYQDAETEGSFHLNFGSDATVNDIVFDGEITEDEDKYAFEITLSTCKDGDVVTESVYVTTQETSGDAIELELGYEWNSQSGDMCVYVKSDESEQFEVECVLTELENGYQLSFPGFGKLMETISGEDLGLELSFDLSVTAGAEIKAPKKIKDIAKLTQMDLMKIAMNLMNA